MRLRTRSILWTIAGLLAVTVPSCGQPGIVADPPTWIFFNGRILTVDSQFSVVEALAVRHQSIVAVGSSADVLKLSGPATRRVDLNGRTVIPGLIDNHYHFLSKAVDKDLGVDVTLVESLAEMLEQIAEKARTTPPGEVIYTTSGWLIEQLAEGRPPHRQDLDRVAPQHPVVVQGGHTLYLNSLALQQAKISRRTRTPPGGIIERDGESGELTGLLVDNAMSLARPLLPRATFEQKKRALAKAQGLLASVGITSIREPGLEPADMRVYQQLRREGGLHVRVSMNRRLDSSRATQTLVQELEQTGVSTGFGDSLLRLDGFGEFGIDGGFEAALMSEPHLLQPGESAFYGLQRIPSEKFSDVMQAARQTGWRPSIHAVGDRGIDLLLDTYAAVDRSQSIQSERWILEHAHYTRPDQFSRIKELGVLISTQFHPYMSAGTMIRRWGQQRAEQSMRLRDWLDAGIHVGGGSDWSLLPANPFWMIYFWVTRDTRLWGVVGADQKISRAEALQVMTVNNAYLTFEEELKGSLEVGKLADLVILDRDLMTVEETQIKDIQPIATILGGEVIYENPDSKLQLSARIP